MNRSIMTPDEQRSFYKGVLQTAAEARQATRTSPPTGTLHPATFRSHIGLGVVGLLLTGCCFFLPVARSAGHTGADVRMGGTVRGAHATTTHAHPFHQS